MLPPDVTWETVLAHGSQLQGSLLAGALVSGVALAVLPGARSLAEYPVTLVHELGHCLAALLTGGRIHRFVVRLDGSGMAWTSHGASALSDVLGTWAGYASPALVGTALLLSAIEGHATAALAAMLILLGLAGLFVGSLFTVLVLLSHLAVLAGLWRLADPIVQTVAVGSVGVMLFGCGLRTVVHLLRRGAAGPGSDPAELYARTGLPRWVWRLSYPLTYAGLVVLMVPRIDAALR